MLRVRARDAELLAEVEAEIHDWFFNLADVKHDRTSRQVLIPFRRWDYGEARPAAAAKRKRRSFTARLLRGNGWEAPWYRWRLTVEQVTSFSIEDEAQMGTGEFNMVSYDSRARALTMDCSFVTLRFEVDALDVELEETAEVLGLAHYRTYGDRPFADRYSGEVLPLDRSE